MRCEHDIDAQLIAAIKRNDPISYNKLFIRYYVRLCKYVYSILLNKDDAEDIIQELFLYIWDNRKKIDIQENVSGYLYKMSKNLTLNHIRKNATYRVALEKQKKLSPEYIEE
ncbi:MAG: RNA polymerase sigma-70 factor, partial [Tannerellaceae bacterium]|nr:RNA polymerase sigma-70 factor [Tannerellaceae bacterium]